MDDDTKARALRAHEQRRSYFQSLHEARLLDARAAVNTALLVNGAASVAVLAFLGSLAQSSASRHIPFDFVRSLIGFGAGVFSAACAATAAYLTNHQYAEAERAKADVWAEPFIENTQASAGHYRIAVAAHRVGYAMAIGTLAGFLIGVGYAADGFTHLR